MQNAIPLHPAKFPDVILLLGTDAAGKDHVAVILETMIREAGGEVEKRRRFFAGAITEERSSTDKGLLDSLQERMFLLLLPSLGTLLPFLVNRLLLRDIRRFKPPAKKLIVVGHNGLRALAFYLGHSRKLSAKRRLPDYLIGTLHHLQQKTAVHIIVLDVDDHIRKQRIAQRLDSGKADNFDQYMAANGSRSERIESALVQLTIQHLGGAMIVNNDLSEDDLRSHIEKGLPGGKGSK